MFSCRYVEYKSCVTSSAVIFQRQQVYFGCFRDGRVGGNGGFKKEKIQYIKKKLACKTLHMMCSTGQISIFAY